MSGIRKNLSVLVVADLISKLLPLMTFPYLTRTLGPELYGKYGFAMNVVGFLMLLASPGLVPYGMRAIAQNPGEEVSIGRKICGIRLLFGAGAALILVIYTFSFAPHDHQIRLLLLLSGLVILPGALNLDWLLTGKSQIPPVAFAGVAAQLFYTAVILTLVTSASSLWLVPVGSFLAELLCVALLFYAVTKRYGVVIPKFGREDFRQIVPTSLLFGFASLMSMTYDKIDTVILGYFRPMTEVGVYVATYKIMWMVMSFQPILAKVFFPLIARSSTGEQDNARGGDARLYLRILSFAAFPLMMGGGLLAEPLTRLLIGDKYAGSGYLLTLLLPNVLAGGMASYYAGMKLVANNRNKEYVMAVAAGALVNLVLNLLLVPLWGAVAAALLTCLSQFTVAGVAAWFGRDIVSPSVLQCAAKPFLVSLFMGAVLVLTRMFIPETHVLLLVALGAALYAGGWYASTRLAVLFHPRVMV